jgi:hypothetical protein
LCENQFNLTADGRSSNLAGSDRILPNPRDPHSFSSPASLPLPTERSQNGIEHTADFLPHVLGQKTQNEVAMLLQQLVLAHLNLIREGVHNAKNKKTLSTRIAGADG